ncbi:MAG TPA: MATE family efflux transporter [Xanthomonadales bacterium]|nr:MATE family efflux transporter [Xanthomonadales bacterium]
MSSDLTTGPVGGHLRRQASAFSLGLVAIFSFEAVNLFFVSMLGDAPLAAVSFTLPVIWLIYGFGIGFEAGTASVVSRAIGRRDEAYARRLATHSAMLATLTLGGLCVVGLNTIDPVFRRLGATPELMPMIHDYMSVWYWVAPSDACFWTCLAALRARGNAQLEARLISLAAVLNLVLDPIFIFGLFGFPRLEVQGAALASLVSNLSVLGITLLYVAGRLKIMATPFAPLRDIVASWRHMLTIGIPAMITNTIIPLSSAIVVSMLAVYGVDAVAGFGVAARIEPFALLVFYSLSAVCSPFFGQNFGAGQHQRLIEARRLITRFCLVYGVFLTLSMDLLVRPVSGLFSESESIRVVAVHYIWLVSWGYGAHGVVMSMNSAFNGTGRPLPAVVISSARVIFLFLPLAWLGRWLLGLEGIFLASSTANVLLAVLAYYWLGRHIRSHEPPVLSG